ncbi:MAG: NAD-dependent DNA ligase LigA [Opitutus sp.]
MASLSLPSCASYGAEPYPTDQSVVGSNTTRDRAGILAEEIRRHDGLYHRQGQPEISDAEYDELKREFATLKVSDHPSDDAPRADGIGDDRSDGFVSHRHRKRMLSLDKAYSKSELLAFVDRSERKLGHPITRYIVEPKFDGIAISATYVDGELVSVATRGDGFEGDDVTSIARCIRNFPISIRHRTGDPVPQCIEFRGEVYLSFDEFKRINDAREAAGETNFTSPRNLAAGSLKSANADVVPSRELDVVFYGIGFVQPEQAAPLTQCELLRSLEGWGIPTVMQSTIVERSDGLWAAVVAMGAARERYPFPTDGVVIKVDSLADQLVLGSTEHAPRGALAYKFSPQRMVTRLKAVALQVGRTGVITPVAELEPVQFRGALIRRASLHNADEIARRDYRIGDHVFVERGGDVIPHVVGVDLSLRSDSSERYVFPERCPGCNQRLEREKQKSAWRCINARCPAQLKRQLQYFATCVGITGIGNVVVDRLVDSDSVKDLPSLYRLRRVDVVGATHLSVRRADELIASIEASKQADLWRFVKGMGFPGVGESTARQLARTFSSLDRLANATEEELRDSQSPKLSVLALTQFVASRDFKRLVAELISAGVDPSARE